jgi:hypothetical protein
MTGFVDAFKRIHSTMLDRRFAFILGAGASKSSGIKLAGEMVAEWITILHRQSADFNRVPESTWATAANLRILSYDKNDPAASYPALYRRMYKDDPDQGYARPRAVHRRASLFRLFFFVQALPAARGVHERGPDRFCVAVFAEMMPLAHTITGQAHA